MRVHLISVCTKLVTAVVEALTESTSHVDYLVRQERTHTVSLFKRAPLPKGFYSCADAVVAAAAADVVALMTSLMQDGEAACENIY